MKIEQPTSFGTGIIFVIISLITIYVAIFDPKSPQLGGQRGFCLFSSIIILLIGIVLIKVHWNLGKKNKKVIKLTNKENELEKEARKELGFWKYWTFRFICWGGQDIKRLKD